MVGRVLGEPRGEVVRDRLDDSVRREDFLRNRLVRDAVQVEMARYGAPEGRVVCETSLRVESVDSAVVRGAKDVFERKEELFSVPFEVDVARPEPLALDVVICVALGESLGGCGPVGGVRGGGGGEFWRIIRRRRREEGEEDVEGEDGTPSV